MSKDSRALPPENARVGRKQRSTNPFDSDFEADESDEEEIFHDAFMEHDVLLQEEGVQQAKVSDAFTVKFLSPLESALFQLNNCERWSPEKKRDHHHHHHHHQLETASKQGDFHHLINPESHQQKHYGSTLKKKPFKEAKRYNGAATTTNINCPVLEELYHSHEHSGESEHPPTTIMMDGGPNAPWTKLLLLEELGTASSWALLLAPYMAVCICLFLESYSGLSTHIVEQPRTNMTCLGGTLNVPNASSGFIILPQQKACLLPVALQDFPQFDEPIVLNSNDRQGWAFLSGSITHVPPMSIYLRAGASFNALSSEIVLAISQGRVLYSTLVVQNVHDDVWEPISISVPETLTMNCRADREQLWNCTHSQMVDVIFSFPGTGILAGTDLRLVVLYADSTSFRRELIYTHQYASNDDAFHRTDESYVVYDSPPSALVIDTTSRTTGGNHSGQIAKLVAAATELTIEHERPVYYKLDFWVRSLSLVITFSFIVFWCRALQSKETTHIWPSICWWGADKTPSHSSTKFWWESPWIVFPERRYLLVMLFCLILLQNPLLILAFLHRDLYRSRCFHAAADCIVGIAVFGILMILHCLFQGLRYHTAEVNRRRAKQQRHFLELRRAANYLVKTDDTDKKNADTISMFIEEHYETFGDVSGFSLHDTRLRHDPCGHDWPDFLLPKIILFLVGAMAVLAASTFRFSAVNSLNLSLHELRHVNMVYITSSFVQLFVAFFWMILIVRQTSRTAFMLRKEPFLSTRPAQLSFRILLGILLLGLAALVVPIIYGVLCQIGTWVLPDSSSEDSISDDGYSTFDVMLGILAEVSRHFPYSGTAASIGPGKIIYATICTLVASIIFLPSYSSVEDSTEDMKQRMPHTESQAMFAAPSLVERKRDKRLVVTLARYTKTWRVFPLPIQKVSLSSSLLREMSFQVDKGERSLAYFGKYTPVFCLELACWLLEASWQAYYTPHDSSTGEFNADRMALESIGLKLENCVCDESTDSQVFIASNLYPQVDGFEDSIIVVGLRGTVSMRNMALDLKLNQVPLLDQIIGMDFPMFEVSSDGIKMNDSGDWFWDSPYTRNAVVKSFTPKHSESCFSFTCHRERKHTVGDAFSQGAKAVLASTPVTRQTLPCVHQGFLEAYSHIRKQVLECIMEVMQRQLSKAMLRSEDCGVPLVLPKIYVTGHSLGGSVGQLLALDLACNVEIVTAVKTPQTHVGLETPHPPTIETPRKYSRRGSSSEVFHSPFDDMKWLHRSAPSTEKPLRLQPPIAVYTYGQPRVGNHAFSRLYKQKVPHTFRVVNEGDALTTMPNAVLLGGQYKHAGLEVMLDEGCTGNILVGPTVVETMFRFNKVRTSLAAHSLERYRENLESGLTRDELHEYIAGHGIQKSSDHHAGSIPDWLTQVKRSSLG